MLPATFYQRPTLTLARDLPGRHLLRRIDNHLLRCRIVEVEAYHQDGDAAAHSYGGPTDRNRVMFGPPGRLYVYFIYGMHFCMNVVSEGEGIGAAVLIRALEPIDGEAIMRSHRGDMPRRQLTNGPAKACKALAVDRKLDGTSLQGDQIWLEAGDGPQSLITTTRIGITKSADLPWRFYIKNHPYVSKPAPREHLSHCPTT